MGSGIFYGDKQGWRGCVFQEAMDHPQPLLLPDANQRTSYSLQLSQLLLSSPLSFSSQLFSSSILSFSSQFFPQFITSASLIIQSVHTAQGALVGLGKTFLKQLQSLLCTHKLGDSRNIYFRPFFTQGTGLKNKTLPIERRGHFNALMLKMSTNHFDIF